VKTQIRIEPLGREITVEEGLSVLDGCLRAGVWLPHACTHGTCGTCKVQLLAGEVDLGSPSEFALLEEERAEGVVLACQATPLGPITIEADIEDEGVAFPQVLDFEATVLSIERRGPDVAVVELGVPQGFDRLAGQYVQWHVPGSTVTRSFSVANRHAQRLSFHVRYIEGGLASAWIFGALATGDVVRLSGPYGRFFLREPEKPVVFLAGSTGLAPVLAMLEELARVWPETEATLIFGARDRSRAYAMKEIEAVAGGLPNLETIVALSDDDAPAGFARGRVDEVFAARFPRASGRTAYIAGPPLMVEACIAACYSARLFGRDIYREDYFSEEEHARGVRSPLSPFGIR
jgi:phenol hydroxylase P5 protein